MTAQQVEPESPSRSLARSRPTQIVVVEDQRPQQIVLTTALEARGYRVHVVGTGREAAQLLRSVQPDLVLVDLGLPDIDGLQLCRHIRVMLHAPIIVVTADAQEGRVVEALDAGADDYVTKPFSMTVLLARIRVALRHHALTSAIVEDQILSAGDVQMDVGAHQVLIEGREIDLQARQFALLALLIRNQGKVLTYNVLASALGAAEADAEAERNSWRILISKIRKSLGSGPDRPVILTELNVGYRLTVPSDEF